MAQNDVVSVEIRFLLLRLLAEISLRIPWDLRAQEQGRMLAEGLTCVGSWVEDTFDRCIKVMECEDLFAFEIVHVVSSTEARDAALSGQGLPQVGL